MRERGASAAALLFAALIFLPVDAVAGAWTLPEGDTLTITTVTYSRASDRFDASADPDDPADFTKLEAQALAEYGLFDWLTTISSPRLTYSEDGLQPEPFDTQFSGTGEIGARVRLGKDDWSVVSTQIVGILPVSAGATSNAALSTDDVEFDLRALYGRGFRIADRHGFGDLQLGYRYRSGPQADEVRIDATLGIDVFDDWLALGQAFIIKGAGDAEPPFEPFNSTKLQLSVVHHLTEHISLQAGGFRTVAGESIIQEDAAIFALWVSF